MRGLERQLCYYLRQALRGERARAPEAGRELLAVFKSLSQARSWYANGPNPIAFAEIQAWCCLMHVPLRGEHVAIIRAMDAVWCEDFFRKREAGSGAQKTLPPVSQRKRPV